MKKVWVMVVFPCPWSAGAMEEEEGPAQMAMPYHRHPQVRWV